MPQTIKLADDLFDSLLAGTKQVTIRKGRRDVALDLLTFESTNGTRDPVTVAVTEVRYKKLWRLTDEEARTDGAANAIALADALYRFYPDMTLDDELTLVFFTLDVSVV